MSRRALPRPALLLGAAALLAADAPGLDAQIRASERASVSQTVDGTVITVDYARPRARGRADLFGGVVHWGEVWTPGANDATVLDLSADVEVEGHAVPAGRWSVWMVTAEDGPWELVLDPRDTLFHTVHPEETEEQIRFDVAVEEGAETDVLTFTFPEVHNQGATLTMAWGTTRVPLDIRVESSRVLTVSPEVAAPYVGAWTLSWGEASEGDPAPITLRYDAETERLLGSMEMGEEEWEMILMPVADGAFATAAWEDDVILEDMGAVMEFEFDGDMPVAFALRSLEDDTVWARGERTGDGT